MVSPLIDIRDGFALLVLAQLVALAGFGLALWDVPLPYRACLIMLGSIALAASAGLTALGGLNFWMAVKRLLPDAAQ